MLLDWVSSPRKGAGLHEYEEPGWSSYAYPWLADRVRGVSAQIRESKIGRDDVVGIATTNCVDFAPALFGALHAGATPLPIAAPPASARAEADRTAAAILKAASPRLLLASEDELLRAQRLRSEAGIPCPVQLLSDAVIADLAPAPPAELALLQFTSGSTGKPRGVRVNHENLESNIAMIREWLDWDTQVGGASWLPLQHDMGLIGMLLVAVCAGRDLWQMKPSEFLVDPLRWLECFGSGRASITAAPTFGYSYAARRVSATQLAGMDFSGWRTAVVGAERVIPEALQGFAALLSDFGFDPAALCPAYGMAEGTLAITGQPRGTLAGMVQVSSDEAPLGASLSFRGREPITGPCPDHAGSAPVVSCGKPLSGLEVRVVGEDGEELPEGTLGEITVRGRSVAEGYLGDEAEGSTRFAEGRLITGDAGFLIEGELYVLGRIADSLKARGTFVSVEDLEIKLAAALAMPLSRCVVVSAPGVGVNSAAVLLEIDDARAIEASTISSAVRPALGAGIEVRIYRVGRNTLLRTTSGKPRRRQIAQMLATGELDAEPALTLAALDAPVPGGDLEAAPEAGLAR